MENNLFLHCCKMWRVVIWVRFRIYSEIKQTLSKLYLNSSCSSLQSVRLFISFRLELRQYLQYQLSLNKLQQHSHTEIEIWKIRMNMQRERVKWNLSVVADTFLLKQIIKYYDVSNWNSSTKHVNMNISIYISTLQDPVLLIRASC